MKPVENTATRLVLEARPVGLAVGLALTTLVTLVLAIVLFARGNDAGVILLVFALSPPVFAYFFLETRRIVFERPEARVTLLFRAPRGARSQSHAFGQGARVVVERPGPTPEARAVPPEGAPGVPTRAVLVADDGAAVPLAEGYSKGPEAWQVAQAANAWLSGETV